MTDKLGKVFRTINKRKTTPMISKMKTNLKFLKVQLRAKENEIRHLKAKLGIYNEKSHLKISNTERTDRISGDLQSVSSQQLTN